MGRNGHGMLHGFYGADRIGDMKFSQIKDIWNCEEMYVLRDALRSQT
jgi:hypothetical protein